MTEPGADNEQQKPLPNQETSISGKISIEFDTKPFDKIVEAIYKKKMRKKNMRKRYLMPSQKGKQLHRKMP